MPFTPSHAVVALAFRRTPLVPAAVAIGAMTPDLPLFVRGTPFSYAVSHDLRWMPVTMIVAFALLLVWRCVLRPNVAELSPRPIAARVPRVWDAGITRALRDTVVDTSPALLAVSLAIGVVTHVVWDLFTHEGRAGVAAVPALEEQWGPLLGLKWLQHGSSVLGAVILAAWVVTRLRRAAPHELRRLLPAVVRWAWWASLPVALTVAWVWGITHYGGLDESFTAAHLAYRVLPPTTAAWGVATVALCVALVVIRRVKTGDTPGVRS
ncbi:DUF4184 family protein [Microbacterium aureliae]